MRILFDTCIIIDALQSRPGFFEDAQTLFRFAGDGTIDGYITAKSFTDIYYLMHSYYHDKVATMSVMARLTNLFKLVDTTAADTLLAMGSRVSDYEDAVMVESAKRAAMNAVVSRDGHMKDADIKIYTPGSLVSEIRVATGK